MRHRIRVRRHENNNYSSYKNISNMVPYFAFKTSIPIQQFWIFSINLTRPRKYYGFLRLSKWRRVNFSLHNLYRSYRNFVWSSNRLKYWILTSNYGKGMPRLYNIKNPRHFRRTRGVQKSNRRIMKCRIYFSFMVQSRLYVSSLNFCPPNILK